MQNVVWKIVHIQNIVTTKRQYFENLKHGFGTSHFLKIISILLSSKDVKNMWPQLIVQCLAGKNEANFTNSSFAMIDL